MADNKSAEERMAEGFAKLDAEENARLENEFGEEKSGSENSTEDKPAETPKA